MEMTNECKEYISKLAKEIDTAINLPSNTISQRLRRNAEYTVTLCQFAHVAKALQAQNVECPAEASWKGWWHWLGIVT